MHNVLGGLFQRIATRQTRKRKERIRKAEAARRLKPEALLQCSDEELAYRLRLIAEKCKRYGYSSAKGFEAAEELQAGLRVLQKRVRPGEADQHPALAPIIEELAARSTDVSKNIALATAVLNATIRYPWRTIARPPGDRASRIEPR